MQLAETPTVKLPRYSTQPSPEQHASFIAVRLVLVCDGTDHDRFTSQATLLNEQPDAPSHEHVIRVVREELRHR